MNNVINIFTKLPLHKNEVVLQRLQALENQWPNDIIEKIRARYGDNQPKYGVVLNRPLVKGKLDIYGHGCVSNSKWNRHKAKLFKAGKWNRPMPFPYNWEQVKSAIEKNRSLVLGERSDPFMWLDQKYRFTWNALKYANEMRTVFEIHTSSDLIAQEDYIQLIADGGHSVVFNVGDGIEINERINSPGRPSIGRMLKAAERLKEYGVHAKFFNEETQTYVTPNELRLMNQIEA